jgi:hypothetical protein
MFRRQEKKRGGVKQLEEDDAKKETPFLCNCYIFCVYGVSEGGTICMSNETMTSVAGGLFGGVRGSQIQPWVDLEGLRGRVFGRAELREGRDR